MADKVKRAKPPSASKKSTTAIGARAERRKGTKKKGSVGLLPKMGKGEVGTGGKGGGLH